MKARIITISIAVILLFSLAACSPPSVHVEVGYGDLLLEKVVTKTVEAEVGDIIELSLGAAPSTGFEWEAPVIQEPTVLKQEGDSVYEASEEPIAGAAGNKIWKFKVLSAGTSNVTLEYSQPWEGGEKDTWKFTLEVTVR